MPCLEPAALDLRFSYAQAVACASAGVSVIQVAVGRVQVCGLPETCESEGLMDTMSCSSLT